MVDWVTASIHSEYSITGRFAILIHSSIFTFTNFRNVVFCDKSIYLAVFRLRYLLTVSKNHAFARYLISRIENPFEKLAVSSSFQLCLSREGGRSFATASVVPTFLYLPTFQFKGLQEQKLHFPAQNPHKDNELLERTSSSSQYLEWQPILFVQYMQKEEVLPLQTSKSMGSPLTNFL